jgi:hypothetical protein
MDEEVGKSEASYLVEGTLGTEVETTDPTGPPTGMLEVELLARRARMKCQGEIYQRNRLIRRLWNR